MRKPIQKPPASTFSSNMAPANCGKAAFSRRMDSRTSVFEIMDADGRGLKYYNAGYWKNKTREEIIGYCKWLINVKHGGNSHLKIRNLTEFHLRAPRPVSNYVRNHGLQSEIGLPDQRYVKSFARKEKAAKDASKKTAKKKTAATDVFAEGEKKDDPYAPLSSLPPSRIPFCPVNLTPPLPEPRYRLWKRASKDEKEKMVDELLDAARKGEQYCLKKLLAMGVPVDARNRRGETALMEAALWWHKNMCGYLLQMGANPRAKNKHGENALSYAKDSEDRETIELIRNAILRRK